MRHTLAAIAVTCTSIATAQQWQVIDSGGPPMLAGGLAWDGARQQLVRYCGLQGVAPQEQSQTLTFDGANWLALPATPPGPVASGSLSLTAPRMLLTSDDARGVLLLYNGSTGQMWEYDGTGWNERASIVHPTAGEEQGFAFDAVRGRAVLTTSSLASGTVTWEWNGNVWTNAATPLFTTLAFSPQRGRVVGLGARDLFEWNGTAWTQLTTNLLPATGQLFARRMAFDSWRQRLIVVDTSTQPTTVLELNGLTLTATATVPGPSRRFGAMLAFDPSRGVTVLCGGTESTNGPGGNGPGLSDTWTWNGQQWVERAVAPQAGSLAMAYDPTRNVLVATTPDVHGYLFLAAGTWERDLDGWHRIATTAPTYSGAMVFDSVRNAMLFCGSVNVGPRIWNGATWSTPTIAVQPPARSDFALAFDAARGETVLFGGRTSAVTLLNDTWLFNGTTWRQATPANSPTQRATAMAFDPVRNETVLFGGVVDAQFGLTSDETWTWNGITWTQRSPVTRPASRSGHAMTFDAASNRIAMVGGTLVQRLGGSLSIVARLPAEPWTWDGTQWQDSTITGPLIDRPALAFDPIRNRLVLQGGYRSTNTFPNGTIAVASSDTLEFLTALPRSAVSIIGCDAAPRANLRGEFLPRLGTTRFAIALTGADANTLALFGFGQVRVPALPLGNGCSVWIGGATTTVLSTTNTGGAARLAVPIPAQPALLGTNVSAQAGYLDTSSQIRTSNVLAMFLGQ